MENRTQQEEVVHYPLLPSGVAEQQNICPSDLIDSISNAAPTQACSPPLLSWGSEVEGRGDDIIHTRMQGRRLWIIPP